MNNPRTASDIYDPHIVPAETAARMEREGEAYKQLPEDTQQQEDSTTDDGELITTDGYTVDREGLLNNYAVEPEMYYEVPGDRREQNEAEKAARRGELHDVNDNDETGKLTMEHDDRGHGSGLV